MLLYQLGASMVVVRWSSYIVHLIQLISNYNIINWIVQAPVTWDEESVRFYATGQAINIPAIAITIAITVVLITGIRKTAIVNLILVIFKIIVLLIFIFACCIYVKRNNYDPFFPSNLGITT
jgi:amino acid transporter